MKIVFLAPFGIRPKGTLIARLLPLAKELQDLGHNVVIIAPPYTNSEDSGKTEVVDNVTIRNVALGAGNKIIATMQTSYRMYRAALDENPDLVHLFKPKAYGGLAAMLFALKNKLGFGHLPLFVDTDDWEGKGGMNEIQPYSSAEKWLFDFQERWLPRRADGVTVASRMLESQVLGMGVPSEKVLYLPNCVVPQEQGEGSKVRQRHGIDHDAPVVLLYTRFFEFTQKRLYEVFQALAMQNPDVKLMVVGQGRQGEDEAFLQASREMGLADSLIMVGWTEPEQIPDYIAAADAAIYPLDDTLVNRAKCPAKLTEIMLGGCPVVADRVGQAAEYIKHDENGMLVDPQRPDEMVEAVVSLLKDNTRRNNLGEKARESVLADFRWSDAAEKLVEFYQRHMSPV